MRFSVLRVGVGKDTHNKYIMNLNYSNTGGYFAQANCPPCNQVSNCPPCKPCRVELPPPEMQEVPTESQLIYIPYSRKVIQHVTKEKVERIPVEKVITEYEQVKVYEEVPIEKKIISYYAVQKVIDYSVDYKQSARTDYVDKEIVSHQVEYVPFERQIVHYPTQSIAPSSGGAYSAGGATYSGAGGATYAGSGGAVYAGSGGATYAGSGGAVYAGSGGATYAGTGGATYAGTGGSSYGVARPGMSTGGNTYTVSGGSGQGQAGYNTVSYGGTAGGLTASGKPLISSNYYPGESYTTGGGMMGSYQDSGFYQELSSSGPGQYAGQQYTGFR